MLGIEDIPEPVAGPEEVLVDIRSTSLNRADLLQRMGLYANPYPETHEVPGLEFAGAVGAGGERVRGWRAGDAGMGSTGGGGPGSRARRIRGACGDGRVRHRRARRCPARG